MTRAANHVDLIVRGGRVVTPTEVLETAVAVHGGKIVALGAESMLPRAARTVDATGKYVLPGLIDCHVHLGAVYDDWHTGPVAAAHAGLTSLLSFVEYDDPSYVRDNPHIAAGLTWETARWAVISTDYQYNWHPLTWLSHALDLSLFGLDPGRHHLVNALLHALNAALLFLALRSLTGRDWASALAAALFALHPLRVESVAWIAERKDLLAGTFLMLALLAYARHARAARLSSEEPVTDPTR